MSYVVPDGLHEHTNKMNVLGQSLGTLLHTVSTYHSEYIEASYTNTRQAFLHERRIARLLGFIQNWFFTAAEDDFN